MSSALASVSLEIGSALLILEKLELVESFKKIDLKYLKKLFLKKELPLLFKWSFFPPR